VNKKGSVTQNHSGKMIKKAIVATKEIKKNNQYVFVDFVSVLINFAIVLQIYDKLF